MVTLLLSLKVDSNEKRGGQEGDSYSASVWHCGDRGLFAVWKCFSEKLIFSISDCYSFKNIVLMNRRSVAYSIYEHSQCQ